MRNTSKTIALILIGVIAFSSLTIMIVKPANAQSISKPSVPKFTLRYVDHSYTVPADYSYTTNPYNGEQTRTGHGEYSVDNKTIELTIQNQPITPYRDPNTQVDYLLCYNVSWKGHYEDAWQYYGLYYDGYTDVSGLHTYGHEASASDNSIFVFGLGANTAYPYMTNLGELPNNSKIDFRVQALFGYYTGEMVSWVPGFRPSYDYDFTGEPSDWSNTQTFTLTDNQSSINLSPSLTVPELFWLILVPLLLSVFTVALIVRYRKTAN